MMDLVGFSHDLDRFSGHYVDVCLITAIQYYLSHSAILS